MRFSKIIIAIAIPVLCYATVAIAASESGHWCTDHIDSTSDPTLARHNIDTDDSCDNGCASDYQRTLANGTVVAYRYGEVTENPDGTFDTEIGCTNGQTFSSSACTRVTGRLIFGTVTCHYGNGSTNSISCGN